MVALIRLYGGELVVALRSSVSLLSVLGPMRVVVRVRDVDVRRTVWVESGVVGA